MNSSNSFTYWLKSPTTIFAVTFYLSGLKRCKMRWHWSREYPGCPRSWGHICGRGEQLTGSRSLFCQWGSRKTRNFRRRIAEKLKRCSLFFPSSLTTMAMLWARKKLHSNLLDDKRLCVSKAGWSEDGSEQNWTNSSILGRRFKNEWAFSNESTVVMKTDWKITNWISLVWNH